MEAAMKIEEVKAKAKEVGVKPGRMNKTDLIRAIQRHEGNVACFKNGVENCEQMNCLWRQDCMAS
jgi:hypothetical protein